MPTMGRVNPATVPLMVRSSHEELAAGLDDPPRFVAEVDERDRQVLDDILGHDEAGGIVLPGPRTLIEVPNHVDAVCSSHIDVGEAGQPIEAAAQE